MRKPILDFIYLIITLARMAGTINFYTKATGSGL